MHDGVVAKIGGGRFQAGVGEGVAVAPVLRRNEGVLCFLGKRGNELSFYLWNPVTQQTITVSLPNVVNAGMLMRFGFDHNKGEFVIVLMTWSEVSKTIYCPHILFDSSIHINGHVYWLSVTKDKDYGDSHIVVGFSLHNGTWTAGQVPFDVRHSKWVFVNINNSLGVATWSNASALHNTYVIWLSRHFECGELGWVQHRIIQHSPSTLRFLGFSDDFLIYISEQMQFYDEHEQILTQGLIFFESPTLGIIMMMTGTYRNPFSVRKMFFYYPTIRVF
ncbi:F-box/kelch-repeat protein [Senna tora]|uniref:F-box/kelch-repeat protein n=1 Tax=Senna tora TaxID=362788 RepID=A0A834T4Q3_9FABA|nr:F-box/kelch-repeat protein [Senna tora]